MIFGLLKLWILLKWTILDYFGKTILKFLRAMEIGKPYLRSHEMGLEVLAPLEVFGHLARMEPRRGQKKRTQWCNLHL
jgi:hypothetical protein